MNTRLCKEEFNRIPVWVKIHDVPLYVFYEDGISIIVSHIRKPIMLDSYTSSMYIELWGRSSFAQCLIEVCVDDHFKDTLTIGVPLIKDSGFPIKMARIEYERKPPRCVLCKIFGHVQDQCPKKVIVTPPINDVLKIRASNVGNTSKSSPSHMSSMSKNQPLKASFPTLSSRRSPINEEGGNITMSNSYDALDDDSEEEIENVYDELVNLFNSTKIGASLSTFTVAAC
ncbi:zinc knuckle CX2CX4HX4C containing protein [Tanacetum coccineum]